MNHFNYLENENVYILFGHMLKDINIKSFLFKNLSQSYSWNDGESCNQSLYKQSTYTIVRRIIVYETDTHAT